MTQYLPQIITIDSEREGQRLDNFLFSQFRTVPKSHIYRWLRKGEVRVNKGRVKPDYRIVAQDKIRIPPVHINTQTNIPKPAPPHILEALKTSIIFEDNHLLVINKPAGIAVHGGSGLHLGVIEAMRQLKPECKHLELAHRLDRETSGCLVMVKKRSTLKIIHAALASHTIEKIYHALVCGHWPKRKQVIKAKLKKNILQSGERMVHIDPLGKPATTYISVHQYLRKASWLEIKPLTGRTHQIRVHTQSAGHPIIGDPKYGNQHFQDNSLRISVDRMFLHAKTLSLELPYLSKKLRLEAPLPVTWQDTIQKLT